ncbi:MAG: large subunit ribosomal protein [Patescibacteria group bacterium]|nr:large subunit ribosomal protein [Patescibacteria group bacterium]
MKVTVYNQDGKKSSDLELNDSIWNTTWNGDLVHQVLHSQMSNQRANTAHTKDRSEVRGGGKKPWAQKGTGRARHGSSRSPIWVGGGVAHGPRTDRNYKETIPRVMKNRALFALLSQKLRDGKLVFVDNITIESAKTKDANNIMDSLQNIEGFKTINWKKHNNAMIFTSESNRKNLLAFRNLPNVRIENMDQMNPLTIANTRYIVVITPEKVNEYLSTKA